MNISHLKSLVPQRGCAVDYQLCLEVIPALSLLYSTQQDPVFHAEGDVWTHTKMVVDALISSNVYQNASEPDQFILFMSALLHDISKSTTTKIDEVTGKISQPGHSRRGAIDTRLLLWRAGVDFATRETICRIISVHQVPFFAIKGDNSGHSPEFLINRLSWELPIWMLCAVATADIEGRTYHGKQDVLDDIEIFRLLAEEKGCLDAPATFVDDYTRLAYFRGANVQPEYPLFRERQGSQVIVMAGPPASGKNTWVAKNAPGLPVISFDDSRTELGLAHGANEGIVAHHATDRAKELLRAQEPFVWNATNLGTQMRSKTLNLLHDYHADVRLVYLEQPEKVLMSRNNQRDTSLRNADLLQMLLKWEVPLPWEARTVEYLPHQ
jgi:predicted kinase